MSKFKDLFIVSDDKTKETSQVSTKETKTSQNEDKAVYTPSYTAVTEAKQLTDVEIESTVDNKIVDQLFSFVVEHNLPGPDYLELKTNASNLSEYLKDETSQYQAAFKVLKGQYPDLKKEQIITAISKYIELLEGERKRVVADENAKLEASNKSTEILSLKNSITEIDKQIAELNKQKESAVIKMTELTNVYEEAKRTIENEICIFNNSVDTVIGQFVQDKDLITKLNLQ